CVSQQIGSHALDDYNCEHLALAAAELSKALLQAGPQVKVLATSRESLRLAVGNHIFLSRPGRSAEGSGDQREECGARGGPHDTAQRNRASIAQDAEVQPFDATT